MGSALDANFLNLLNAHMENMALKWRWKKHTRGMKVCVIVVAFFILAIIAGAYYLKIRPEATTAFKKNMIDAIHNLDSVFMPFADNKTPSVYLAIDYLLNASRYFENVSKLANILLINSTPYSTLAEITRVMAKDLRETPENIHKSFRAVWNSSDDGADYLMFSRWLHQISPESPSDFVEDCQNTNWPRFIEFMEKFE